MERRALGAAAKRPTKGRRGSSKNRTPTGRLSAHDTGAETRRNFRYQSAYGVVLLVGAATGAQDYKAVWCEQEDDLLAEISPTLYDSFQVKTQDPELGPWDTKKKGFISAIRVFARLQRTYPDAIRNFNFVSNTKLLDSTARQKRGKSPIRLQAAVTAASSFNELDPVYRKSLQELSKTADCTPEEAFEVIGRLRFAALPPTRESFIAELATNHLPHLEQCKLASSAKLKRAAFAALYLLDDASSLSSQHPARHYACLDPNSLDPHLLGKRVSTDKLLAKVALEIAPSFRFSPQVGEAIAKLDNHGLARFVKKLNHGGLEHYVDTLRSHTISSEQVLIDIATRGEEGNADLSHLRTLVKAQCDLAHLNASVQGHPFGKPMLQEVVNRLSHLATNEPAKVCEQSVETLIGIAGMLTEECEVWWSEKFNVEES